MDGYLQKPRDMDDATLKGWVANFQDQPPTMDYMAEHSWAMAVLAEYKRREADKAAAFIREHIKIIEVSS